MRSPAGALSTRSIDTGRRNAQSADRGIGVGQLQRRDRDAITMRERRDADRTPMRVVGEYAGRLARKCTIVI